jgi:hypothetical protein
MTTNGKKSSPALAKGQLWRTEKGHIRIVELGKMLVHYKMLQDLRQMRRTQMSRIDSMEGYLKTNRAQLVESGAVAAQPDRSFRWKGYWACLNDHAPSGAPALALYPSPASRRLIRTQLGTPNRRASGPRFLQP